MAGRANQNKKAAVLAGLEYYLHHLQPRPYPIIFIRYLAYRYFHFIQGNLAKATFQVASHQSN
ncbi:hypothetical protein A7P84_01350 [Eikenella corrodens]|jgi:hypothetical protein|nr:hypothetical protein A7P84_01350 [Eikenella corrodens]